MNSKIPCLDLSKQHQQIKEEVFREFEKVYEQTAFSGGPFVEKFEKEFAAFCQTPFAIGVNNGTSALHLAMLALNIGPGDEVILFEPFYAYHVQAIIAVEEGRVAPSSA